MTQGQLAARLVQPAAITIRGQNLADRQSRLDVGGGRVTASGTVADTLDLMSRYSALPLAIANTIRPDLGWAARWTAARRLAARAPGRMSPSTFRDDSWSAAALARRGLRSLAVDARGTSSTSRLNLDCDRHQPGGPARQAVRARVPLDNGDLALDVALDAFPLAVLERRRARPEPWRQSFGLRQRHRQARRSRRIVPACAPRASGQRPSTAPAFRPLDVDGRRQLRVAGCLTLSSATVNGPQGLTVSASGRIPLAGDGLASPSTARPRCRWPTGFWPSAAPRFRAR